ncbi:MAG TPA: ADP-ribosylglycohydrolase family protein [Blastocatellia bacterium]|nr:ADP-ribosylglycohydrolase family protein [Blastocatellia bacterium]
MRDQILGCILGGAIGDALGGPHEGKRPPIKISDDDVWRLSDDTQLTLATCEAILSCGGSVDPAAIADRFARWHRGGRVRGMGASTFKALSELVAGGHWALVGRKGEYAAGNGAAMRAAPLAFCLDPNEQTARQTIRDVSRITHHHEEAYAGALTVVIAVRAAAGGAWDGSNSLLRLVAENLPDTQVRDRLIALAEIGAEVPLLEIARRFGSSGYVVESVPLALCGASRIESLDFKTVLIELIACGGDTDTIASIAGQVVGALIGRGRLPEEMIARTPERDLVETVAGEFAESMNFYE